MNKELKKKVAVGATSSKDHNYILDVLPESDKKTLVQIKITL